MRRRNPGPNRVASSGNRRADIPQQAADRKAAEAKAAAPVAPRTSRPQAEPGKTLPRQATVPSRRRPLLGQRLHRREKLGPPGGCPEG